MYGACFRSVTNTKSNILTFNYLHAAKSFLSFYSDMEGSNTKQEMLMGIFLCFLEPTKREVDQSPPMEPRLRIPSSITSMSHI